MFQYERLSENVASKIKDGTYQVGEKLPSVRALSRSLSLSVTTVLEAYRRLEDQGLIAARAKSGYYILPPSNRLKRELFRERLTPPKEIPFGGLMQTLLAETGKPDIIRLGLAQPEPDVLPQDNLDRILRRILRTPNLRTSDYLDPKGLFSLRAKIAALMLERGVNITASEILVTNGCQQALRIALECVIKKGEIIATETPCYPGLLHIASEMAVKVMEIPARADTGISLTLLAKALESHKIKAIFLTPTCSNPNGSTIPLENREKIITLARRKNAYIIEDDTNRDLYFGPNPPISLKCLDRSETVIFCGSFSKTLGPGMRLGWMIPGPLMEKALAKRYIDDLGGPAMEQHVLAQFVGSSMYYRALERAKRAHAKTTSMMVRGIREHFPFGTQVGGPSGGFLLWVKLPGNMSGQRFREAALEAKISIAPGTLFSEIKEAENFIRIGWGGKWGETVDKTIATLGRIAKEIA